MIEQQHISGRLKESVTPANIGELVDTTVVETSLCSVTTN